MNTLFELKSVRYKDILNIKKTVIEKGKVTCISGESGAGKSTLMKLLNKMHSPDEGAISFNGRNVRDVDSITLRREVPMLSQSPLIFPGTIKENLEKGLKFAGKGSVSEKEMLSCLKKVFLDKQLEEDAGQLSGGEKQRLALARVLLLKADAYLLDEPTSGLDEETEEQVLKSFIREVKARDGTIIMISHSKRVLDNLCEEQISLQKNRRLRKGDD